MPRPLRIEFENAQYHVMNRGAGHKPIFKTDLHRKIFIELLAEANKLFKIEIHAYCLMNNHYHLLVETPYANLGRVMRHINGLYTQQYNKIEKTDGALFRGRYKAIIVSYDEYFLNVSRYIHLNPVAAKIVEYPHQFQWSSYKYFIDSAKKPGWLNTNATLSLLDCINESKDYGLFVKFGIDIETIKFYEKENTSTIFGSINFKDTLLNSLNDKQRIASITDYKRSSSLPSTAQIISTCSQFFNIAEENIFFGKRGKENEPRKFTIYACRRWSCATLSHIASLFHCRSHSNISNIVSDVEKKIKQHKEFKSLKGVKYSFVVTYLALLKSDK